MAGCGGSESPGPGSTDVYLVELSADGQRVETTPFNLTSRDDYDNQPAFLADSNAILYTSRRGDQTDIRLFDLDSGIDRPLTRTLESEYSASRLPSEPGFSVVRVEQDQRQRLWRFDADGGEPSLLLERPDYVGYYAWVDERTVALFVLGEPPTLHVADLPTGESRQVAEDIGRSLQPVPGRRAFSFVQRESDAEAWIEIYDLDRDARERLVRTPARSEDHAWTPAGDLLIAEGAAVLRWSAGSAGLWMELADFAPRGLGRITRLAVSDDGRRLALVADRAAAR